MVSDDHHVLILKSFEEKMQIFKEEDNVPILVNSFDALEHDALSAIGTFNLIPIGPLVSLPLGCEVSTKQQSISCFQDGMIYTVLFGFSLRILFHFCTRISKYIRLK